MTYWNEILGRGVIILPEKTNPAKPEIAADIWASATKNRHKSVILKFMRTIFCPDFSCEDNNEKSAELLVAAYRGEAEKIPELLRQGADIDAADILGFTGLVHAAENGHQNAVQVLLEHGADVNAGADMGNTAVVVAAEGGHLDIVRLLLEYGANVDSLVLNDKLLTAAKSGQWQKVWALLEQGADINAEDEGDTALCIAAEAGETAAAATLLDRGADVNCGYNALRAAAKAGHGEMVRLLLERVSKLSQQELDEFLIEAAAKGHLELVKVLLNYGADVWAQDYCCRGRAIDVALDQGHDKVATMLREAEALQPKPACEGCGKEGTR